MHIGALQKFSLIEYPGKICAIIFTQGCNFRCGYCHNPELVDSRRFLKPICEREVFAFLERRKNKLDGVSITGGEPTLQPDLELFIGKIKDMGFLVKLDSNGSRPQVLENVCRQKIVDYIAMDIKAPLGRYREVSNSDVDPEKIRKSVRIIMNSGIDYEFRTTIVKSQLAEKDIIAIGRMIEGARLCALQSFAPTKAYDPAFLAKEAYPPDELAEIRSALKRYVKKCIIR